MRAGLATGLAGLLAAALLFVLPALAQQTEESGGFVTGTLQSPILTVDSERMFSASAFGRKVAEEIERRGAELAAENRRIEAELAEEERALTERRAEMEPDAFRAAADAFDERVMRIRREQDAKARALAQRGEQARRRFFEAARPVLEQMMVEAGAAVIVEQRSVFMSLEVIDITEEAIERLDATIDPNIPAPEDAPPPEAADTP
ncbi:OmpH family outer membrane protein [Rhodosalinus halophilus]|uniref:OmpH family outer membrane protein n=1 Tax=Rhodosalinus halophilus TaxID=2259333 RepID=A0A365U8M2_9RHOB|nr:OmpH family outer membrane protein [Rhodosalinus halophilus]RBI85095.1 OmpH family outer membrane protein [Rhodosalinus halophilus]